MPRRTKLRSAQPSATTSSRRRGESFDDMEVYGAGSDFTSTASSYTSMTSMEITGRRKYDDYKPEAYHRNEADEDDDEEIYVVRQNNGYFAILFSLVQTAILGVMMWQCGIAPIQLNPMFGPYPDALSEWGGKNAPLIVEDGEWWRLFTPILLHAGLLHLAGNIAVQLEMGMLFEKEWGSIRWLIIYIGSGAGSSIMSVIYMPQAVSVGSSGAVMGLFGAKLSEILLRICERDDSVQARVGQKVRREQCCAVTCSVIVVLLFSFVPYVDWAAHVGGLLSGLALGFMIFSLELEYCFWQLFWLAIGFAVTVAGFMAGLIHMYSGSVVIIDELRDVCGYYTATFADYQCNCMRSEYFSNMNNNNA